MTEPTEAVCTSCGLRAPYTDLELRHVPGLPDVLVCRDRVACLARIRVNLASEVAVPAEADEPARPSWATEVTTVLPVVVEPEAVTLDRMATQLGAAVGLLRQILAALDRAAVVREPRHWHRDQPEPGWDVSEVETEQPYARRWHRDPTHWHNWVEEAHPSRVAAWSHLTNACGPVHEVVNGR